MDGQLVTTYKGVLFLSSESRHNLPGQTLIISWFEYSMLLRLRHCISRLEVTQFLTVILVGESLVSFIRFLWQICVGLVLDRRCPDR